MWNEEQRAAISRRNKGRPNSEEAKKKIGDAHRGKVYSPETRAKIAVAHRRPVLELTTGKRFGSVQEAAEVLGICRRSVSCVLSGRFKQTNGYRFQYEPEVV